MTELSGSVERVESSIEMDLNEVVAPFMFWLGLTLIAQHFFSFLGAGIVLIIGSVVITNV